MSFINEFLDMLACSVTHEPRISRDEYGAPTFGAATSYTARIQYKTQMVRANSGEDVLASGSIIFGTVLSVTADDRITLPDGSQPLIISWESPYDEKELVYTKVYFGGR